MKISLNNTVWPCNATPDQYNSSESLIKKSSLGPMPSFRALRKFKVSSLLGFAALFLLPTGLLLPTAAYGSATTQQSGPPPQPTEPQLQNTQPQAPQPPASNYDKAIFLKPIPADQLAFLNQFAGAPSKDLFRDKQFHKLMKSFVPDCMFHYGRDMPLSDALEMVIKDSPQPVEIRDGRYLMLSGRNGPYLAGRGFLWIDMQDGIALGGVLFSSNQWRTHAVSCDLFQASKGRSHWAEPTPPGVCRRLNPVVHRIPHSAHYDALLHHWLQQKDPAGARRRLLHARGRDNRTS